MDQQKIIIAIDGHSSCGKSTLAKALAKELDYAYVDSGAMYRAVTLFFLQNEIDYNDDFQVLENLKEISIEFKRVNGENRTFLNGEDVEKEIRGMEVNRHVSPVAAITHVRRAMVKLQQALGKNKGIVMDGRDIGTVVFPDAALKLFLTADMDIRTNRRFLELQAKGIEADWEQVSNNLKERDHIDSSRADSPLRKAEDAVVLDNTLLNEEEQLEKALELVKEAVKNT